VIVSGRLRIDWKMVSSDRRLHGRRAALARGSAHDSPQIPDSPAAFLESRRDIQIKEATNRAGLLSFLFHDIREPLKQTRQNQPTM